MKKMNKVNNIAIAPTFAGTLAGLLTLGLLSSCGKSDATKDYQDLKLVPISADSAKDQEIKNKFFNIESVPSQNLSEGDVNEFKIKLNILDSEIKVATLSIDSASQPVGSTLEKTKEDANTYIFRWTPPVGFIKPFDHKDLQVKFIAHVVSGPAAMSNFFTSSVVSLTVRPTKSIPKIVLVDVPEVTDEGQDIAVKIKVLDKAHGQANQPDVNVVAYKGANNVENHKFDWHSNVLPDQPLVDGPDKDGVFTFHFMLHTKNLVLPNPPNEYNPKKADANASIVNLCFTTEVKSKVSLSDAATEDQCTRVRFAAQPPVVYFEGDPTNEIGSTDVIAGAEMNLSFEVKTPNGRGDIQAPRASYGNFASAVNGTPKIEQVVNAKDATSKIGEVGSDKFYKMTWTPSCKASGAYLLKMRLSNKFEGQQKTFDVVRKLNIITKSESCTAAPLPAAKSVPSTAVVAPAASLKAEVPSTAPAKLAAPVAKSQAAAKMPKIALKANAPAIKASAPAAGAKPADANVIVGQEKPKKSGPKKSVKPKTKNSAQKKTDLKAKEKTDQNSGTNQTPAQPENK
jgi:hypothetical protein